MRRWHIVVDLPDVVSTDAVRELLLWGLDASTVLVEEVDE